jgi:hypothetical protein
MRTLLVVPAVLRDRRAVRAVATVLRGAGMRDGVERVAVLQSRDRWLLDEARAVLRDGATLLCVPRLLGKWGAVLYAVERRRRPYDWLVVVDGDGAFHAADGLRLALATHRSGGTHGIGTRAQASLVDGAGRRSAARVWTERYLNALLLRRLRRRADPPLAAVDIQCGLVALARTRLADLRRAAAMPYGGEMLLFAATVRRGEVPRTLPVRNGAQLPSTLDPATVVRGAMAIPELAGASARSLLHAIDDAADLYGLGARARTWLRTTLYPALRTASTRTPIRGAPGSSPRSPQTRRSPTRRPARRRLRRPRRRRCGA